MHSQVASGLHHIHSSGFVHRDVKPHNILIQRTGAVSSFGPSPHLPMSWAHEQQGPNASTAARGRGGNAEVELLRQPPHSQLSQTASSTSSSAGGYGPESKGEGQWRAEDVQVRLCMWPPDLPCMGSAHVV